MDNFLGRFFIWLIFASNMFTVITGSSKGLGKAMAIEFARNGHHLLLNARNEKELNDTINQIKNEFGNMRVDGFAADLSQKEEVNIFAKYCLTLGTPDILINNAGRFLQGSIAGEPEGQLELMLDTNLMGAYHLTRALLPAMKEKRSGHIFNICSVASIQAYPSGGSYGISKYAFLGFSKNLREELKIYNIKVTSVIPGAVYTDSWKDSGISEERIMQPNDLAVMVTAAAALSPQATVEEIIIRPQLGDL